MGDFSRGRAFFSNMDASLLSKKQPKSAVFSTSDGWDCYLESFPRFFYKFMCLGNLGRFIDLCSRIVLYFLLVGYDMSENHAVLFIGNAKSLYIV